MGSQGIKTEHAGHKGSGRKSGFWGLRADAKYNSKRKRRTIDKQVVKEEVNKMSGENMDNKIELATIKWKEIKKKLKLFKNFFDKNFPKEDADRVFLTIFKFTGDLDEEISTLRKE